MEHVNGNGTKGALSETRISSLRGSLTGGDGECKLRQTNTKQRRMRILGESNRLILEYTFSGGWARITN